MEQEGLRERARRSETTGVQKEVGGHEKDRRRYWCAQDLELVVRILKLYGSPIKMILYEFFE